MKIFLKITQTNGLVYSRHIPNNNMLAIIMDHYQSMPNVKSVELDVK
jgi:hypothetical protein